VRSAIVTLCERRQREGRGHAEGKAEAKQREGRCDLTVLILGAVALMREAISMHSGAISPCSYWERPRSRSRASPMASARHGAAHHGAPMASRPRCWRRRCSARRCSARRCSARGARFGLRVGAPPVRCNQMQSEAIRGNQRQSDAIRSNQMQSEAIRCNQIQSDAIRCNQMQSDAIRCNQM
jgi:hypothetical protein